MPIGPSRWMDVSPFLIDLVSHFMFARRYRLKSLYNPNQSYNYILHADLYALKQEH